jgi:hypothetical protein
MKAKKRALGVGRKALGKPPQASSVKHQAAPLHAPCSMLPALMSALKDAGYTPVRITRLPAGTTELHLKPAGLKDAEGNVRAESICNALGLPCSCKRLASVPQPVLAVRVTLPDGQSEI